MARENVFVSELKFVLSLDVPESHGSLMASNRAATKIYHPEHGYESTLKHVEDSLAKFQFSKSHPVPLHFSLALTFMLNFLLNSLH